MTDLLVNEIFRTELWHPVYNLEEEYLVSDQGNVKSLYTGDLLSKCILRKDSPSPRHIVSITVKGISRNRTVSGLVLEAFVNPRPQGMIACHGPNGSLDDSLFNVYWSTHGQNNNEDRYRDKTILIGSSHPRAKLTETEVLEIRQLHAEGWSYNKLERHFKISGTAILNICKRKTWRHV